MIRNLKEERQARIKSLQEKRKPIGVCEDGKCVVTCMGVHKIVGMRREPPHTLVLEVTCKDNPVHEFRLCEECFENLQELVKVKKGEVHNDKK